MFLEFLLSLHAKPVSVAMARGRLFMNMLTANGMHYLPRNGLIDGEGEEMREESTQGHKSDVFHRNLVYHYYTIAD